MGIGRFNWSDDIINIFSRLGWEKVGFTDERVKVMNETLQGVRVVKLYAWEVPSQRRIQALRISEILKVAKYQLLKITFTVN